MSLIHLPVIRGGEADRKSPPVIAGEAVDGLRAVSASRRHPFAGAETYTYEYDKAGRRMGRVAKSPATGWTDCTWDGATTGSPTGNPFGSGVTAVGRFFGGTTGTTRGDQK